ncbi:MAG: leucine-rich repeat protein, partial [Eubacterium sp.]|nr:leucine-rich repeat protein [Eubacterium sp.]
MVEASGKKYCYSVTPKVTDASYNYLNEIYIKKYPEMGLELVYGSEKDKQILQKLAITICKNCKTDEEKCLAISRWVKRNIKYSSYSSAETYYFPIDVFANRNGNCLGYALLMTHLMRVCGIPAVPIFGTRGDMKKYVELSEDRIMDHAWVMAYYKNDWFLYDPLFEVENNNDRDNISKRYFTDSLEGITPYYQGIDTNYYGIGVLTLYKVNRFLIYQNNQPASQYNGNSVQGGYSINSCVSYFAECKYQDDNNINDGFDYVDASRANDRDKMICDECYTNGWISYGGQMYLARHNGVLYANTFKTYNGKNYFMTYDGSALEMPGSVDNYITTQGFITIKVGDTISGITPTWKEDAIEEGKVIVYTNDTPDIVSVSNDGVIKGLKEGLATVWVCSKDTVDGDTHYMSTFIQLYVTNKDRKFSYEDTIKKETLITDDSKKGNYVIVDNNTVEYKSPGNINQKSVTIPQSTKINGRSYKVKSISNNAFIKCKKLTNVTIGKNIEKIGNNAFKGCKRLKKVTI